MHQVNIGKASAEVVRLQTAVNKALAEMERKWLQNYRLAIETARIGGAPSAHASSHVDGGSDELDVAGLSGLLADAQTPLAHTQATSTITTPVIGTPAYSTQEHLNSLVMSAGVVEDGTYVTQADATHVNVALGRGLFRVSSNATAQLVSAEWAAVNNIEVPTSSIRYIGVRYNAGAVAVVSETSFSAFDWYTSFPIGKCYQDGTDLHIVNALAHSEDTANLARKMLRQCFPFTATRSPEGGGLLLSDISGRYFGMTAGSAWHGFNFYDISAFNSSGADRFSGYYRNGAGGFTEVGNLAQWPNTQYDNGSGTLATMTNNRWAVLWWYVDVEDGDIVLIYGRTQYVTQAQAEDDLPPPTVPPGLNEHSVLLGRFIFQKSAATATVQSAITQQFQTQGITVHNDLSGLQGGTTGEYYHLTAAEAGALGDLTALPDIQDSISRIKSTGLISGGEITINADPTKVDIAAGTGVVVDNFTDAANPTRTAVTWTAKTAVVDPFLATATTTYWGIDSAGNTVTSDAEFTPEERRDYISLGWSDHTDLTEQSLALTQPQFPSAVAAQVSDFLLSFGAFNIEGNDISATGALAIARSAGKTFEASSNYGTDVKSPNIITSTASDPTDFYYYYRTTLGVWVNDNAASSNIDPDNWDDGDSLEAVPAGKWTVQLVSYYAATDSVDIQYGQNLYDSSEAARTGINEDVIEIDPYNSFDTLRAWLIVKQGATDLTNTAQAQIVPAGKLGLMGGASGGGAAGEVNAGINVGTTGAEIYDGKTGVDLRFRKLTSLSSALTVAANVTDDTIEFDTTGILDDINALADASGALTNDGAGNLSWAAGGGGGLSHSQIMARISLGF